MKLNENEHEPILWSEFLEGIDIIRDKVVKIGEKAKQYINIIYG